MFGLSREDFLKTVYETIWSRFEENYKWQLPTAGYEGYSPIVDSYWAAYARLEGYVYPERVDTESPPLIFYPDPLGTLTVTAPTPSLGEREWYYQSYQLDYQLPDFP